LKSSGFRPPPKVASLKFHLTADAWEYPDWALFVSFSSTTGDDLQLVEPAIRAQLEQVQRVVTLRQSADLSIPVPAPSSLQLLA